MKTATITQVKNQLSAFIDMVRQGETILVLDRTVPVAKIESPTSREQADEGDSLGFLERGGVLGRGRGTLPKGFFAAKLPRAVKGASITQALLRDREGGR
jgi:antitoxin (DNA-binding transcriptional repressor) of toxin-antitoxin stability system